MKLLFSNIINWTFMSFLLTIMAVLFNQNHQLEEQKTNLETKYNVLSKMQENTINVIENVKKQLEEKQKILEQKSIRRDTGLNNKITILDESIGADSKRKAEIHKVAQAIKDTAPNNYFEGCRKKPTPGTINTIATAVVDLGYKYGVSKALILGIIRRESGFCQEAVSHAGARGLMQLMPETAAHQAQEIAAETGYAPKSWRIKDNIWLGTYYISKRLYDFNGDEDLALKAYNAGIRHVKQVLSGEREDYYEEPKTYARVVLIFKKEYEDMGL